MSRNKIFIMLDFIVLECNSLFMVDSVASSVSLPEHKMVMMREYSDGFSQLASYIHNSRIRISNVWQMVVFVGRVDMRRGTRLKSSLNKLIHALCTFGKDTKFIFIPPIPQYAEHGQMLKNLAHIAYVLKHGISNLPGFTFWGVTHAFGSKNQVHKCFVSTHGVTTVGIWVLSQCIQALVKFHRVSQ